MEGTVDSGYKGSANENHFANNQWESLLQITNQKKARSVKRAIITSDVALLLIELVESFAITICHRVPIQSFSYSSLTGMHTLVFFPQTPPLPKTVSQLSWMKSKIGNW